MGPLNETVERTESVNAFTEPGTDCNNYTPNDSKTTITLAEAENRSEGPGAVTGSRAKSLSLAASHDKGSGD